MNFRSIICLALGGLFMLTSCDNEFELTADWKSIPVVYGLINTADTAHYIRVEKAFLDPKIDAFTIAQNADSLYFDNVTVQIERSGSVAAVYNLERVDGNKEGYVRDEGTFAHMPNYLYKFKLPNGEQWVAGDVLDLKITTSELSDPITASTIVGGELEITKPRPLDSGREIGFLPDDDSECDWRDDTITGYLFDIVYYIHYRERLTDNDPFENKTIRWEVRKGIEREEENDNTIKNEFPSLEFYQILEQSIEPVGTAIRRMDSVSVEVLSAGEAVLDYIKISRANSGITSSQVIPNFTNLSEGRGIFSTSGRTIETGYRVQDRTKDELEIHSLTSDLNFR